MHAKKKRVSAGKVVAVLAIAVFLGTVGAGVTFGVVLPSMGGDPAASSHIRSASGSSSDVSSNARSTASTGVAGGAEKLEATSDADLSTKQEEETYLQAHKGHPAVNELVAQCKGIDLRSPVAPADLTGVLFHQSATPWAYEMTTQLPEANMEEVGTKRAVRVNHDQFQGSDWLDCEAMHIWRSQEEYGAYGMDTSVDIGAKAGTVIRAPVTGTVIHLRDYRLYDELDDVEIHIQPEGRPDLDVVLIHTKDVTVKPGDKVEAGVTEIAAIRDIAASITDVQLGYYTEGDDPGNHTHIQVNDPNYKDYREKRLKGAIELA